MRTDLEDATRDIIRYLKALTPDQLAAIMQTITPKQVAQVAAS